MIELNGKIDKNDLAYVIERFGVPIASWSCPIKGGRFYPHVSRFLMKDYRMIDVVHQKPVYYRTPEKKWRPLYEVADYYGNKNGMILKEGWENKIDFGYLGWYLKRQKLIRGKGIKLGIYQGRFIKNLLIPLHLNTDVTFYPDANPETTSVDGWARQDQATQTWATLHDAAGNDFSDTSDPTQIAAIEASTTADRFNQIFRSIFLFDSSSIPDSDSIDAATMSVRGTTKSNAANFSPAPEINVYTSNPASNTGLTGTDYSTLGTVAQSDTNITHAGYSTTGYNDFVLNATGRGNVSKTSVSKFGIREATYDAANVAPTWVNSGQWNMLANHAEAADVTTDPKLAVTHTGGAVVVRQNLLLLGVG